MGEYYMTEESDEVQTMLQIKQRITHDGTEAYRFICEFDSVMDRERAEAFLELLNSPITQAEAREALAIADTLDTQVQMDLKYIEMYKDTDAPEVQTIVRHKKERVRKFGIEISALKYFAGEQK